MTFSVEDDHLEERSVAGLLDQRRLTFLAGRRKEMTFLAWPIVVAEHS